MPVRSDVAPHAAVTHKALEAELAPLREAILVMAYRLGNELGTRDSQRIVELLTRAADREP